MKCVRVRVRVRVRVCARVCDACFEGGGGRGGDKKSREIRVQCVK